MNVQCSRIGRRRRVVVVRKSADLDDIYGKARKWLWTSLANPEYLEIRIWIWIERDG